MEYTIYVYWKKGLIAEEKDAAIRGVNNYINILRSTQAIGMPNDNIKLCGVDAELESFVQNLLKIRSYTNAEKICEYLDAMLPEYAIGVYLTNEPLCDNEGGYIVGLMSRLHITVSTYHFRNLSRSQRLDSIELCIMHELGHAHGMAGTYGRVNSESNHGPHCADALCLMRQPHGNFVPLIREHHDRWFCPLCLEDARLAKLSKNNFAKRRGALVGKNERMRPQRSITPKPRSFPSRLSQSSKLPPPLPPRRSGAHV